VIGVRSEVGRLREVLVHEPGPEVDLMVPSMMDELLFEDILFGDRAREEHARFRRVLQLLGVRVREARLLLEEALEEPEARSFLLEALREELSGSASASLEGLSPAELASAVIQGVRRPRVDRAAVAPGALFSLAPLPNWCFQRDPQIVLGEGVVICSMAPPARKREASLARTIFRFHPAFRNVPILYDAAEAADSGTLEGGDLVVLSEDVILVGQSERTSRSGIESLCRALERRDRAPRWVLAVVLPRRRAYMHLDTVFLPVDRGACLVYPQVLLGSGPEAATVFERDLHERDGRFVEAGGLFEALRRRGFDFEPIFCGGSDPIVQQREQWTDGVNALAIAPGVIVLYDRNRATAEELARHGFRAVEAEDLLLGREEVALGRSRRSLILLKSNEISRARGGPHCLAHPLLRED